MDESVDTQECSSPPRPLLKVVVSIQVLYSSALKTSMEPM